MSPPLPVTAVARRGARAIAFAADALQLAVPPFPGRRATPRTRGARGEGAAQ
jgi:hypothetical protein